MPWTLSFVDFVPQFLTSCDTSTKDGKNHKAQYHCYDGRVPVVDAEVYRKNTSATLVCFPCQRKKTVWSSIWSASVRATSITRASRNLACWSRSSLRNWFARVHQDTANQNKNLHIYSAHLKFLKNVLPNHQSLISAARATAALMVIIIT